jgi:hypothetical protein
VLATTKDNIGLQLVSKLWGPGRSRPCLTETRADPEEGTFAPTCAWTRIYRGETLPKRTKNDTSPSYEKQA